jgi:hypothetical protein
MALNFNLMNTDLPGQIATSFTRGYEGAQDRANVLAQQQQQRQVADMQIQNALRTQQDVEARRAAFGATNPVEVAGKLRTAGLGEEALKLEQQNRQQIATSLKEGAKSIAMSPTSYKSIFQRARQTLGIPLDDDEKRYDEAFATGGEDAVRRLAAADAGLGMQVFGGSMYDPSTGKVITPSQKQQPPAVQEFLFAQTPEGGNYRGSYQQFLTDKSAAGRAPRVVSTGAAAPAKETTAAPIEFLTPKEREKRESKFPQATSALKGFEAKTNTLMKDLQALKNHEGLNSITGLVLGRTPALTPTGARAQALYDKIIARGQFQELQDMRNASPTGGALGNVSNTEGEKLRAAFAALDRRQDPAAIQKVIDDLIVELEGSKERVRDAYDMTYEYRQPSVAPSTSAASGNLSPAEQAELDQLRKRFGK